MCNIVSTCCIFSWVNYCGHRKCQCIHVPVPWYTSVAAMCVNHCQTTMEPGGVDFKSESRLCLFHLLAMCEGVRVCTGVLGWGCACKCVWMVRKGSVSWDVVYDPIHQRKGWQCFHKPHPPKPHHTSTPSISSTLY